MSQPLLSVKNVSVAFDGVFALHNVSFTVEPLETLAVIGPNGAGKTVLFRALIGSAPYTGEIQWAKNVRIGYVPQKLDLERDVPLSLQDFLAIRFRLLGERSGNPKEAIEHVHLPATLLSSRIGDLSSGQFQRALIAFALIGKPNVLLFDEPTASIDFPREEQIYDMLHELQDEYGLTLLLISHDLNIVYRYATTVLCLNQELLCHGAPQTTLTPEALKKVYGTTALYHHHHDTH